MPRSKKATPSVSFTVLSRATGITLTAGTMRDVPTLGFDPQEPTFVVGGIIKYVFAVAAGTDWIRWALVRKERASTSPDITTASVLRDLWEDKHLLASGYFLAPTIGTEQGSPLTAGLLMVPVRKTTLRDDEELGFILSTMVTLTDGIEHGVSKYMHKRV